MFVLYMLLIVGGIVVFVAVGLTRHEGFARENGLSLFFATIFLATLVGQSFAGQHNYNADQAEHGQQTLSWWHYVVTPDFGGAVMENWQSEFLQFSRCPSRRRGPI
jgi:Domain of unknown function (DUF6766)